MSRENFVKKTSTICLFLIALISFSFSGWAIKNQTITNFYYYQNKPFSLTLKPDMLFIKFDRMVSESEFRNILSDISPIARISGIYDEKDKRYFVELNTNIDESDLLGLVNRVTTMKDVQYCSPVFSPDGGKTLIGTEDEVIVQFSPTIFPNDINSYLSEKNLSIVQTLSLTGGTSYVLRVPANEQAIEVANEIYRSGKVNWSEPNLYFTNLICYDPNDQFYPMQWAPKNLGNNIPGSISGTIDCDMDADSAWNITLGISECKIAISDTGVDTLHEDLAANMVVGSGYDFYNNDPWAWDDNNHGTACAGIVAAIGNNSIGVSGIAPNCRLIPVKWLSSSGNGNYTGAINATIWSYQKGAWVISNSWGFIGGSSSALDAAINDASNLGRSGKGTVFVVASGNENGAMRYPASTHPRVLVVGGISPCNQRKSPSSCDLESFWGASYGSNLDLVAPCVKIYTTDRTGSIGYSNTNYFSSFNGTSSATPNTAGVCALGLSRDSTMTWDTLRVRIDRTCEKRGSYTYNQPGPRNIGQWNNEMGYGLINARLLLQSLVPPPPPLAHDILTGPFLSLPSQFVINNAYNIRTAVANLGTSNETGIPIRFFINGVLTNTTNINLNSGASDSVTNSWTPASPGTYTLTYASGLATDSNRANDTVRTTVTVQPSTPVPVTSSFCRNGLNLPILDLQTTRDSMIVSIPNALNLLDVNVKVDTVIHTYDGDLVVSILHAGTTVTLSNRRGGSGDNFIGTIFNDSAALPISSGSPPFTGSFRPEIPLSAFNGLTPNGSWTLTIADEANVDTGFLRAWCITISYLTLVGTVETINIPNYYSLAQNYPNPFNPVTSIKFSLPKQSNVKLVVYDALGREVATLVNGNLEAGVYNETFDGSSLASGVYFYRIDAGEFTDVKKMVLIK
jgi:subtilisin family serine protease/subtilisin-like proprotein convertase family protein